MDLKSGVSSSTPPLWSLFLLPLIHNFLSPLFWPAGWILWDERIQGFGISVRRSRKNKAEGYKKGCAGMRWSNWNRPVNCFLFSFSHRAQAQNPSVRGCYCRGSMCRAENRDKEFSRIHGQHLAASSKHRQPLPQSHYSVQEQQIPSLLQPPESAVMQR